MLPSISGANIGLKLSTLFEPFFQDIGSYLLSYSIASKAPVKPLTEQLLFYNSTFCNYSTASVGFLLNQYFTCKYAFQFHDTVYGYVSSNQ
jgi:hypothetical protein